MNQILRLRQRSLRKRLISGRGPIFEFPTTTIRFQRRSCVPRNDDLQNENPTAAHPSSYGICPRSIKMYQNLRQHYWRNGKENDIARLRQKPGGTLDPLEVPKWKWESATIDIVQGEPKLNEITILFGWLSSVWRRPLISYLFRGRISCQWLNYFLFFPEVEHFTKPSNWYIDNDRRLQNPDTTLSITKPPHICMWQVLDSKSTILQKLDLILYHFML